MLPPRGSRDVRFTFHPFSNKSRDFSNVFCWKIFTIPRPSITFMSKAKLVPTERFQHMLPRTGMLDFGRCISNQLSRVMSFAVRNTSSKRIQFKIRAPKEFATFSEATFHFSTEASVGTLCSSLEHYHHHHHHHHHQQQTTTIQARPPRPRNAEEKIEHLERKLKIYVRKGKQLKAEAARLSLKELRNNINTSIDAFSEDEGDEDEIVAEESQFLYHPDEPVQFKPRFGSHPKRFGEVEVCCTFTRR